jgi:hypothetical protein
MNTSILKLSKKTKFEDCKVHTHLPALGAPCNEVEHVEDVREWK